MFTIDGAGVDIWGTADQFHFVYQQVDGDVEIVARVESVTAAHAWSKAGVMIRATLAADAPHAYALASSAKGVNFQRRATAGALSASTAASTMAPPAWVRAVRAGSTVTTSWSTNGSTWTTIGSVTLPLGSSAYVGIAVTSHNADARATATVSDVSVIPLGLPAGHQNADVGAPAIAGRASHTNGVYTIVAAGADIWGTADQFHFVYRPMTGNGDLVARVQSVTAAHAWSKAGLMVRESLAAESRHAMALTSAGKGYAFQRRPETGGLSVHTGGGDGAPPGWVRLVRAGDLFQAYRSSDGVSWTEMGSDTIPMAATVYVGLAVTSHNTSAATTAVFDNVDLGLTTTSVNIPPAVSITTPTSGASYTMPATVAIEATATDPEGRMASVEFYAGSALISRATTAPYTATWSPPSAGTYALTAVAHDADGGTTTSGALSITVLAPNAPPTVSITAPAIGASYTMPASVGIEVTATDPEGRMASVEFYAGSALISRATTAPYTATWSPPAAGTYALTAVAHDADGGSTTSGALSITVLAPNAPPTVTLTGPSTGTSIVAPATIELTATASDPEGQLTRVDFLNGTTVIGSATASPFSFTWSNVPQGTYTLQAIAYDAAGAAATSGVVTINVIADSGSAPRLVVFAASPDHASDAVTNYVMEVFAPGADPDTATPIASSDLGKPAAAATDDITVDRSAFFSALAPGSYIATVSAIGPGGRARTPVTPFTR